MVAKNKNQYAAKLRLARLLSYENVSECPFLDRLESFRGKFFSERERFGSGGASTETSSFAFLGGGGFYYVSKPYQGDLCWPHGYIYILKDLVDELRAPLNSERSNFDGVLLVLKEDVCLVQSVTVLNSPLKINSLFDQSKAGNVLNIEDFPSWCISHRLGEEGIPPRDF